MPSSAEQYIHRLGRTARAGASGRGVLILAPFEKFFLQQPKITALPISAHRSINDLPTEEIDTALDIVGQTTKEQAYRAWLGYYATSAKKMNLTLTQLVEIANTYAVEILRYKGGQPPPVLAKTVGLMGLKGVPGLNIQKF
jgi:ATP-dependent RNA helicase MSS116